VQEEPVDLSGRSFAATPRLARGVRHGDHDVAEESVRRPTRRKREDVGRAVPAPPPVATGVQVSDVQLGNTIGADKRSDVALVKIEASGLPKAMPAWLPDGWAGGVALLAHLDSAARPVAGSLQSAGAALGAAAVLLVLAAAGLERSDL